MRADGGKNVEEVSWGRRVRSPDAMDLSKSDESIDAGMLAGRLAIPQIKRLILERREGVGFFPGMERRIALDQTEKLDKVLQKAKRENKTLLIYDEAGHQVQWLQYHLVDAGVKNYYFMKGGAKAYYDMLTGKDAKEKK